METVIDTVNGGVLPLKNSGPCNNDVLVTLIDKKSYIPLASCLVEYIISNSDLNELEKLFYLLVEMHAQLTSAKDKGRCAVLSGKILGEKLGISEQSIFKVQGSLEKKGFLKIIRTRDSHNQNCVNKIFPTMPQKAFIYLCENSPMRDKCSITTEPQDVTEDDFNSHINNTKLFIKFNLKQIEFLFMNSNLTNLQKLAWVYCYMRSYISYVDNKWGEWRFSITRQELANKLKCAHSTASKAVVNLEKQGFITNKTVRMPANNDISTPRRKIVLYLEALVPQYQADILLTQKDRSNLPDTEYYEKIFYDSVDNPPRKAAPNHNFSESSGDISQKEGDFSQKRAIYNKDQHNKNKNNKNNNPEVVDKIKHKKLDIDNLEQLDIVKEKHLANIKILGKKKATKATNYAKKLKKLGIRSSTNEEIAEEELVRQFVHHAANFKMTKLGINSRENEVDAALNFAYKAVKEGRWKCPQGWGEAIDMHLEMQKYMYLDPEDEQLKKFKVRVAKYLNFSKPE